MKCYGLIIVLLQSFCDGKIFMTSITREHISVEFFDIATSDSNICTKVNSFRIDEGRTKSGYVKCVCNGSLYSVSSSVKPQCHNSMQVGKLGCIGRPGILTTNKKNLFRADTECHVTSTRYVDVEVWNGKTWQLWERKDFVYSSINYWLYIYWRVDNISNVYTTYYSGHLLRMNFWCNQERICAVLKGIGTRKVLLDVDTSLSSTTIGTMTTTIQTTTLTKEKTTFANTRKLDTQVLNESTMFSSTSRKNMTNLPENSIFTTPTTILLTHNITTETHSTTFKTADNVEFKTTDSTTFNETKSTTLRITDKMTHRETAKSSSSYMTTSFDITQAKTENNQEINAGSKNDKNDTQTTLYFALSGASVFLILIGVMAFILCKRYKNTSGKSSHVTVIVQTTTMNKSFDAVGTLSQMSTEVGNGSVLPRI